MFIFVDANRMFLFSFLRFCMLTLSIILSLIVSTTLNITLKLVIQSVWYLYNTRTYRLESSNNNNNNNNNKQSLTPFFSCILHTQIMICRSSTYYCTGEGEDTYLSTCCNFYCMHYTGFQQHRHKLTPIVAEPIYQLNLILLLSQWHHSQ